MQQYHNFEAVQHCYNTIVCELKHMLSMATLSDDYDDIVYLRKSPQQCALSYNYRRWSLQTFRSFREPIYSKTGRIVDALPKHFYYYEPSNDLMHYILFQRIVIIALFPTVLTNVLVSYLV
jgi:hypothetical protein